MSPEINQQGQIVHGPQVNIGVMYGDIVYRRIELTAPLRTLFDPLIVKHRASFGGRKKEREQIADLIRRENGGYLAITANAGFGKTSLMAVLSGERPDAFAYHFFTPLYGEISLRQGFFLRNIVQQMAAWHGEEGEVPAETDQLAALYHKYLDKELPETRVLLIDGLDEVTRWSLKPYLQRPLPDKLQIIVTIRDVGQDWRKEYDFPAAQLTHIPMDGLSTADIRDVLIAAGSAATALAADENVVTEIGRLAAFDAQKPETGADPFYVAFLAQDLARRNVTVQELAQRPSGLDAYLDEWWKAIRKQAGDEATRDLFGTLAAALGWLSRADLEAINSSLVDDWAGDYFDEVLRSVRRFVVGDGAQGYALVHPRLRMYLRDPRRIKAIPTYEAKLRAYCQDWEAHRSVYALRYGIAHLAADEQVDVLFATIADPAFRETQQEVLGDSKVTLDDLRLALQIALDQDRPLPIIKLVAAFRDTTRSKPLTQQLFTLLNGGLLEEALAMAGRYPPATDWPRLLYLYLAFETAVAGDAELSKRIAQQGLLLPAPHLQAISDAFVAALARLLAAQVGDNSEVLVAALLPGRDAAALLATHEPAPQLSSTDRDDLIARIEPQLARFEQLASYGESEAVISVMPMLEQEARSDWYYADDMRVLLYRLAADPLGWDYITRTLVTILPNPYREYRDIGLEVIARALLAAPVKDPPAQEWLRSQWQAIFLTTLDQEGVTFTFDLPTLLLKEAKRRDEPVDNGLEEYRDRALGVFDKWGTRMRVYSSEAADDFHAGDAAKADGTLAWVAAEAHGYAGLATGHLLAVANRWLEFGQPQRPELPLTQSVPRSLVEKLDQQVKDVRDATFRGDLERLVKRFHLWRKEPEPPDVDTGLLELRQMQSDYARNVYIDYLSARWSWPPETPNMSGLKALLPLVLGRGTLLDLVLARLVRAYLTADPQALDADELAAAQTITSSSLTTGRPWDLIHGPWAG